MTFDTERLYNLLPAIYRNRDAEKDGPLKAFLSVIGEQVAVLEENLEQLYDDQFIETCAGWVVPYIGDLIGYRTLHNEKSKYLSTRAEVANTIAYRRRKGTATMLEQLARDVTGWPARVVEFFQLLATTQFINHIRPLNRYAPDLRDWEALERLNTPFDRIAHTVDVRRIATDQGRYNIPNIGIFLWRLQDCSLTDSPAAALDDQRFFFSPLGYNAPLFTRPEPEEEITHLAEPINVPEPISRRILDKYPDRYYGKQKNGKQKNGKQKSIFLRVNGDEIDISEVKVCDLSDAGGGAWDHVPTDHIVAIDPVLGRIALGTGFGTSPEVRVSYHYGFSADLGGGEYERAATFDYELETIEYVTAPATIQETPIQDGLTALGGGGIVQIEDSARYDETPSIEVIGETKIELRAKNEKRPTLVLSGDLEITCKPDNEGKADGIVTLNGLLITGGRLVVPQADNELRLLRLRHCTLVPGIALNPDGAPAQPDTESLFIELPALTVEIDHCIVGGLRVAEGVDVKISNSIVDATDKSGVAYSDPDGSAPGGALEVVDSTVIGKVHTKMMRMASNTIFWSQLKSGDTWPAPVLSERKQAGCVRFSYVPDGARLPRRYRCQPDLAIQKAIQEAQKEKGVLSSSEKAKLADQVRARIRPVFTDLRYGQPAYAQLALSCPVEIRTGADDESEMGAFHELYQPRRETNLRVRLDEYLRFGLEAGIFYVN